MSWLGTWAKRRKVTVSNANIDSNLTHFPLLLTLGDSVGTGNTDVSSIFDELNGATFDDFNSYANGDLNGQGFWRGNANFDVQETIVQEGAKAIHHSPSASEDTILKDIPQANSGSIIVRHRREAGGATDYTFPIRIYEGNTVVSGIQIYSGDVYLLTDDVWVDTGYNISANTFHKFEIEWREDVGNPQVRMRMDDGSWTTWDDTYNDWTTGINNIGFRSFTSTSINSYWDNLEVAGVYNPNATKIALTKTDGVTQIYGEIEKWDNVNETAIIWVSKSDLVLSASGTTDVYLYYDKTQANNNTYIGEANSTPAESVWDANFKAVYHMANGVSNSAIYDSTSNNNDGSKKGAGEPSQIAGQPGFAQDFDGSDDYIAAGTALDFTTDSTIEAIFKPDAVDGDYAICGKENISIEDRFYFRSGGLTTKSYLRSYKESQNDGGNDIEGGTISAVNWNYGVLQFGSGGFRLLLDNTEVAVDGADTKVLSAGTSEEFFIGQRYDNTNKFKGLISELRVSNIDRSDAYLKANKYNFTDALVAWSAEEESPLVDNSILLGCNF